MWLLNANTHKLEEFHGKDRPKYAILSHTWEKGEVSFVDVQNGTQDSLQGWSKIQSCCKQALADSYAYVWADTCCIDKRNIVDLSEALNSMFRWYKEAAVCYTYLSDMNCAEHNEEGVMSTDLASVQSYDGRPNAVSDSHDTESDSQVSWAKEEVDDHGISTSAIFVITGSRWFTRGWTLQELIAPKTLVFYDASWTVLGTKADYLLQIASRTNIPCEALQDFKPEDYCIAQKMAWAARRRTTRPEDRAYSLLGLLGISLNLIYGEGGEEAFLRLQRKLIKRSDDTSILAWNREFDVKYSHWLLAPSPDAFEGCHIFHEYKSCATGLELSKSALVGKFITQIDCFELVCACLGHFAKCPKDRLPLNLRNIRDCDYVNAIGIPIVETYTDTYIPAMLDGKQYLLFNKDTFNGHDDWDYRRNLNISPPKWKSPYYSSLKGFDLQKGIWKYETSVLICPARFWPDTKDENVLSLPESQLSLLQSRDSLEKFKDQRVYSPPARDSDANKPLLISPLTLQRGRTYCFVFQEFHGRFPGPLKVAYFGYDITMRPTVHEGRVVGEFSSEILEVGAFQHVDTNRGVIEVASQHIPNNCSSIKLQTGTSEPHTCDGHEFSQLVVDGSDVGALLPEGTVVRDLLRGIKIVFIPQKLAIGSEYRVLLAFHGDFNGLQSFPRAWLWPIRNDEELPKESEEHERRTGNFTSKL